MPKMKHSMVLFFAMATFFVAFLLSLRLINKTEPGPALQVVGAVRDIKVGSTLRKEDLDLLPAPQDINPKVFFTDFAPVIGKVSRRSIAKGEAIKNVDLLAEGDNMASLIPEGYRAMTIPVTLPVEMSSLLQVGNRIDVLLTHERTKGAGLESLTLIENAKVIGVSEPPGKGGGLGGGIKKDLYITLAVTPTGAETLAYAMKKGTLTVTVRSLQEAEHEEEKFYSLKELFFNEQSPERPKSVPVEDIEVIRGTRKETYNAAKGDDTESEGKPAEGNS